MPSGHNNNLSPSATGVGSSQRDGKQDPNETEPRSRESRRVLVVDDDPDMLGALVDLLELDADYVVDTASDFDSAEASARAYGPGVALLPVHPVEGQQPGPGQVRPYAAELHGRVQGLLAEQRLQSIRLL